MPPEPPVPEPPAPVLAVPVAPPEGAGADVAERTDSQVPHDAGPPVRRGVPPVSVGAVGGVEVVAVEVSAVDAAGAKDISGEAGVNISDETAEDIGGGAIDIIGGYWLGPALMRREQDRAYRLL